jgi:hypothetical protein
MWLSILIVVLIIGGLVGAVAGGGIFGFVPLFLGIVGLVALFISRGASSAGGSGPQPSGQGPEDTVHSGGAHTETGYAHRGQEHMTG